MGEPFQAEDVWARAFQQTYGAELRAEPAQRARELCDWYRERYRTITPLAIMASGMALEADASTAPYRVPISPANPRRPRLLWVLRRLPRKPLTRLPAPQPAI